MRLLAYIPWLGSLALESVLVFLVLRRSIRERFSFFCAYVLYDLAREITLPATAALSSHRHLYFYLYWLSIPIEYTLTFLLIVQIFAYLFRAHILDSPKPTQLFIWAVLILFAISAILVFVPGVSVHKTTALILALDRSIEVLICGLLLFMWTYSIRLGLSMHHHVWGIVFGLGIYSSVSLIVAAINAATGYVCPGWITALPHFAYFASTAIWTTYLFRKEPELPPLTDERLAEYQNLIETYKVALAAIRKAIE
jgi:hypothetical protein